MRKVVILLGMLWLGLAARSQVYMNGLTINSNNQYLELYNSGITPNGVNLSCYTIVTYFKETKGEGFYVLTLPQFLVPAQHPVFISSAAEIPFANGVNYHSDINWNDVQSGVTLKKYMLRNETGKGYVAEQVSPDFTQLFSKESAHIIFLYNGTSMVDAFIGARQIKDIPDYLKRLPDLSFVNTCGNEVSVSFSSLYSMYPGVLAKATTLSGGEYGFYRNGFGECNDWNVATSAQDLAPGFHQASFTNSTVQLATAFSCQRGTLSYIINRGVSMPGTFTVRLYVDNPPLGVLSPNDVEFTASPVNYTNTGNSVRGYFTGLTSNYMILVLDAPGVCYDIVRPITCNDAATPLSNSLQTFDIQRNNAMVQIAWQTVAEQNDRGYELQRRSGPDEWTTIAYVAALAPETGSNKARHYLYEDMFPFTDQTEYRLKQVDITGQTLYSEIKSLPGQTGYDGLIVYPNPTSDGRVNVHFDDINTLRQVELVSMSGGIVREWRSINNHDMQINNLYPGDYVLRVIDQQSGTVSTKKVIVTQ